MPPVTRSILSIDGLFFLLSFSFRMLQPKVRYGRRHDRHEIQCSGYAWLIHLTSMYDLSGFQGGYGYGLESVVEVQMVEFLGLDLCDPTT
jgi:hypothetical protein